MRAAWGAGFRGEGAVTILEPTLFAEPEMTGQEWPWPELEPHAYHLIMIDCPWHFETRSKKGEGKSPQSYYDTMTLKEIASLPVAGLAAPDCVLWMWATAPMLDKQLEILKGWGFDYKTSGVWTKRTNTGKLTFGTGYLLRNAHELFLLGTRGRPKTSRSIRSVINAERSRHSEKPDASYAAAERLLPSARRVEIFSRTDRLGWETWGLEKGTFNADTR